MALDTDETCIECGKRSVVLIPAKSLMLGEHANHIPFCAEHGLEAQRSRLRVIKRLGGRVRRHRTYKRKLE